MTHERLNAALALADTLMSATSLALMTAGFAAIRKKRTRRHRDLMLAAAAASFAFLILFVIRFAAFGFREYHGTGAARVFYRVLFFAHEPLAVLNIPLVLGALALGLSRAVAAHKDVAKLALPVWMFVSATGIVLYVVLYQLQ